MLSAMVFGCALFRFTRMRLFLNGIHTNQTIMAFQPKQVTRATSWSDQVEEGNNFYK